MTDTVGSDLAGLSDQPPGPVRRAFGWIRANLFSSVPNAVLTLLAAWLLIRLVPPIVAWVVGGNFTAENGRACQESGGACWAFIGVWYRFLLFGRFPYAEQWRPLLVIVLFVAMIVASCDRRAWGRRLIAMWVLGLGLAGLLMAGGVFGMAYVETALWNGLPLTLILAVGSMAVSFPLAVLLALGRRSEMPAVRALSVAYIELIRGVPLITILFMASVMLPLFLPAGTSVDKLLRAAVAFTLFSAAYLAEVVRGGLQAVPKGQYEAADALGLGYWRKMRLVVLPQALTTAIPPLVNTFIGNFKDTSLVVIIGLFDLLNTANVAVNDPNWRGAYVEAYLFVAVIYFVFCFFMSRYSQYLERSFSRGKRR